MSRSSKRFIVGSVLGLLFAGCGSTTMTPLNSDVPDEPPREPTCDFQVYTTAPEGFTEVGVVDVKPGGYGHNVHTDIASFKEEIRPHVCRAGGDAAIAFASGTGVYLKATILRRAKDAASAPAPDAGRAAQDGGCRYDTQCKGDRICVEGRCMPPGTPPAPAAAPVAPAASAGR